MRTAVECLSIIERIFPLSFILVDNQPSLHRQIPHKASSIDGL